jgi:hypothetical protein
MVSRNIWKELPPTFNYRKAQIDIDLIVNVLYSIKFEVCVEGLLADFNVTKPLTIAIDPCKHENDGTITLIDRAQSNP